LLIKGFFFICVVEIYLPTVFTDRKCGNWA